jgi:hypothetical protein
MLIVVKPRASQNRNWQNISIPYTGDSEDTATGP